MLDGVAMVATWRLHHLLKVDRVGPIGLLLIDHVSRHDELATVVLLVLLAPPSLGVISSLIRGISRGLALTSAKVGLDSCLVGSMAGCKIEQLLHHPWLVVPELMDKSLVGGSRDECSDNICVDDVRELIALLVEVADILLKSLLGLLLAALEIPQVTRV